MDFLWIDDRLEYCRYSVFIEDVEAHYLLTDVVMLVHVHLFYSDALIPTAIISYDIVGDFPALRVAR